MKITKLEIKNFRSIKDLTLNPSYLCALVGENNSGKSNILQAINLVLGESWPSGRQINDDDVYNREIDKDIEIKIWFDEGSTITDATGRDYVIKGFLLRYTHYKRKSGSHFKGDPKFDFVCIDDNGNEIKIIRRLPKAGSGQRPIPETVYVTSEIRDRFPVVFIGVNRDLKYHLSGSQWTLFGKLLKEIEREFLSEQSRKDEYAKKMSEVSSLLRIPLFEQMEKMIEDNVKKQTGFKQASLAFKEPPVLSHYKSLELTVKESDLYSDAPALEMGSGVQSAIVIALIQAYRELQKSGGILMIEEPEVYLHPHTRRFFYQLLHGLSEQANQVFYTTHSVEFLDLSDYSTIAVVRKLPAEGTKAYQPSGLSIQPGTKKELKLLTEFDARRNELFFAKKVLLVEGATEKHSIPFAFKLLGHDVNEQGISIIDVGGKENLEFFIIILNAFKIPYCVLHDEDRNAKNYLTYHDGSEGINKKIEAAVSATDRIFRMDPDFEGVLSLPMGDKVKNARDKLSRMADKNDLPGILIDCVNKVTSI
ncbi:MAG TPA: AAA family ATPase [Candidatus Omnitrophota bacterium]|nr:AAA family ATPase [Candidatus Omnitrophota bacterium]